MWMTKTVWKIKAVTKKKDFQRFTFQKMVSLTTVHNISFNITLADTLMPITSLITELIEEDGERDKEITDYYKNYLQEKAEHIKFIEEDNSDYEDEEILQAMETVDWREDWVKNDWTQEKLKVHFLSDKNHYHCCVNSDPK